MPCRTLRSFLSLPAAGLLTALFLSLSLSSIYPSFYPSIYLSMNSSQSLSGSRRFRMEAFMRTAQTARTPPTHPSPRDVRRRQPPNASQPPNNQPPNASQPPNNQLPNASQSPNAPPSRLPTPCRQCPTVYIAAPLPPLSSALLILPPPFVQGSSTCSTTRPRRVGTPPTSQWH